MITWNTPAGNLGVLTERILVDIPVDASSDLGEITYTLLAGRLPRGLRLEGNRIKGSPTEVNKFTEHKFVIRASDSADLEDRTFILSIDGSDIPEWITNEGYLKVGEGEAYFVLDNAKVEFQLEADDPDLGAGDTLEFYLMPQGGELPPGLTLSRSGLISGFTDPVFALEYTGNPFGGYDVDPLDVVPLDFIDPNSNGFDSFFYDIVDYDYYEPSQIPRRLSRIYSFVVAVTDGRNTVNRLFKIYVVTEEFLQADNSILQVDTNLFQASSTAARNPIWITEGYLGRVRANNYVTIYLDVYDPPTLEGTIAYLKSPTNAGRYQLKSTGEIVIGHYEITNLLPYFPKANIGPSTTPKITIDDFIVLIPETVSTFPPGMTLDSTTGDVAGLVPYQAAITKNYQFTIAAVNFSDDLAVQDYDFKGDWLTSANYITNDAVRYLGLIYIAIRPNRGSVPPTGGISSLDWIPAISVTEKIFNVDIIGEIESSIEWMSDENRGTLKPNQPSRLFVEAKSLLYGGRVAYDFVSGSLPPGLNFLPNGLIEGKVYQFADDTSDGLTRFYEKFDDNGLNSSTEDSSLVYRSFTTTFDNSNTSFDRKFTFTIRARDAANFAESLRSFYITINDESQKTFANIYLCALQNKEKRLDWFNFITDATIFKSSDLYRYGDTNYGVQTDLKVLLYAGVESVDAVNYVQAMSRNHYRKRLLFGDLQISKGKDPDTQETLYEVIYVNIVDDLELNGKSISQTINLSDTIESKVLISYDAIKVDSDIPFVSDSDHQRVFPNSIKNMRKRIRNVGDRDRTFLPLWMRSIQDSGTFELGYTKSLVLCYANPGKGESILARIRASGFDFKQIDFTADRYLIDVLDGQFEDKYLAFPQRGEKLP